MFLSPPGCRPGSLRLNWRTPDEPFGSKRLHRQPTLITGRQGFVTRGLVAVLVGLSAAVCVALSGCSPGADYPSFFPGAYDRPPPRTEAPLDANQVQQATEDLISARDRLSAEAQGGQNKNSGKPPAKSAAAAAAKKPPSAPPTASAAARQTSRTDDTQRAGAETK